MPRKTPPKLFTFSDVDVVIAAPSAKEAYTSLLAMLKKAEYVETQFSAYAEHDGEDWPTERRPVPELYPTL